MKLNNNTETETPFPGAQTTVLVVEDNLDIAELLCLILNESGFRTRHAATAAEGKLLALAEPLSAFVLDVDLPDSDGFQLCRWLKSNPTTSRTPVIFCTGRLNAMQDALAAGGVDCVAKPNEVMSLPLRIRQAIDGQENANQRRSAADPGKEPL